ncbi:MAG: DUF805 domain-containing protein [Planctomycetes bacterium]|nr:DUF805 domain-containing protein [Planctomycetota bacterium]
MSSDNPYQPPQVDAGVAVPNQSEPKTQTLVLVLFSFQGRIPRRVYWATTLALLFVFYAIVFAVVSLFGPDSNVPTIVFLMLYIPLIWVSLAIQVKRWHDRDKSGWWILVGVIPIIGPLWAFAETGCLRGTVGPNSYGADPT